MVGFDGTGGAAHCSVAALTFLGRPLGRGGLTASVDAEGGRGGVGLVWPDVGSSVVGASGDAPRRVILAAKACSTSLASSADRRFLAFKMAIARGCRYRGNTGNNKGPGVL
jgi:hypothetical protein